MEREKANIIDAIARTGLCDVFSDRLNQIEAEITTLSSMLQKFKAIEKTPQVTEDIMREYFRQFQDCIAKHDIPQIKRFIHSYVKRVEIYPDTVKVLFQVALTSQDGFPVDSQYEFETTENRNSLMLA